LVKDESKKEKELNFREKMERLRGIVEEESLFV